jgi:glycosyltransferase involved in cell wall biosynthesis
MKKLCVLLPAFNEAKNIAGVVRRVRAVKIDGVDITALVVNDGSRDRTGELAEEAGATVVSHPRNRGVGAAFRTGINWAREQGFDYLIHMDSDGQVMPEEIPKVFAPVARGAADLALGSRFIGGHPENMEGWKALALRSMAITIGALVGRSLSDVSCGFRCMNRKVLDALEPSYDYDYIQESLLQAIGSGARCVDVAVTVHYEADPANRAGMSKRVFRYTSRFVGITARSLGDLYLRRARSLIGA